MNNLIAMQCPICEKIMENNNKKIRVAKNYDSCCRKCQTCDVAYSNAKANPVLIYKNYSENVPCFIDKSNLESILSQSINVNSRKSKISKFASVNSEDALSYVFMMYFIQYSQEKVLLEILGLESNNKTIEEILLWGTPILNNNSEYRNKIISILKDKFNEKNTTFTEPDIIIKVKNYGLIIIEVKYKSFNDIHNDIRDFHNYDNPSYTRKIKKVTDSTLYELYRNWALGNNLVMPNEKFLLINLGPNRIFEGKNRAKLDNFLSGIHVNEKRIFNELSWETLIQRLDDQNFLPDYLRKKINAINKHSNCADSIGIPKKNIKKLEDVEDALNKELREIKNLYKSRCVNWKGKTDDSNKLMSEVISEILLKNLFLFNNIKKVTRSNSYRTIRHFEDDTRNNKSNRYEEIIAKGMLNKEYENLGVILDYQVPLKNSNLDKGLGKIDLVSYNHKRKELHLIELKINTNNDSLLRATLECFTYAKTIDQDKLIRDFGLEAEHGLIVKPTLLLGSGTTSYMEYKQLKEPERRNQSNLLKKLNVDCYLIESYCMCSDGIHLTIG